MHYENCPSYVSVHDIITINCTIKGTLVVLTFAAYEAQACQAEQDYLKFKSENLQMMESSSSMRVPLKSQLDYCYSP